MDTKGFTGFFWGNAHAPAAHFRKPNNRSGWQGERRRPSGPLLSFLPLKKVSHNTKNTPK